jgi:hypothetical protein
LENIMHTCDTASYRSWISFLLPLLVSSWSLNSAQGAELLVSWTDTASNEFGFRVERTTSDNGAFTQIAQLRANVTTYTDAAVIRNITYCYRVRAYNVAGNSAYSGVACGTPDAQPPTVTLTLPAAGAIVSGTTTVAATATDNKGVVSVQFQLNNVDLGAEDTTAPYGILWDTSGTPNGNYTLTAVARDAAGNTASSAPILITVGHPALLTIVPTGTGNGTVTSTPAGISCGATCAQTYAYNTLVTLKATPAVGSIFSGWGGPLDCTNGSVTMTVPKICTATFTATSGQILTIRKVGTGNGTITSTPAGIKCGIDCTQAYAVGASVTLTPTATANSFFAGWLGGGCSGTGSCLTTVSAASSVSAIFHKQLLTHIGVFRPGSVSWLVDRNGNGRFDRCVVDGCSNTFGTATDRPVVGDWSQPGVTMLGVFDPLTALWELDRNGNGRWQDCGIDVCRGPYGTAQSQPVSGHWAAGMSTAAMGVFMPSTRLWYLDRNNNGKWNEALQLGPFGLSMDRPVVGDWSGSGVTRIGVYRPSTGYWYLDLNGDGHWNGPAVDVQLGPFGGPADLPVAGRW